MKPVRQESGDKANPENGVTETDLINASNNGQINEFDFICHICERRIMGPISPEEHERCCFDVPKTKTKCPECDKIFMTGLGLKHHLLVHYEASSKCKVCLMKYKRKYFIKRPLISPSGTLNNGSSAELSIADSQATTISLSSISEAISTEPNGTTADENQNGHVGNDLGGHLEYSIGTRTESSYIEESNTDPIPTPSSQIVNDAELQNHAMDVTGADTNAEMVSSTEHEGSILYGLLMQNGHSSPSESHEDFPNQPECNALTPTPMSSASANYVMINASSQQGDEEETDGQVESEKLPEGPTTGIHEEQNLINDEAIGATAIENQHNTEKVIGCALDTDDDEAVSSKKKRKKESVEADDKISTEEEIGFYDAHRITRSQRQSMGKIEAKKTPQRNTYKKIALTPATAKARLRSASVTTSSIALNDSERQKSGSQETPVSSKVGEPKLPEIPKERTRSASVTSAALNNSQKQKSGSQETPSNSKAAKPKVPKKRNSRAKRRNRSEKKKNQPLPNTNISTPPQQVLESTPVVADIAEKSPARRMSKRFSVNRTPPVNQKVPMAKVSSNNSTPPLDRLDPNPSTTTPVIRRMEVGGIATPSSGRIRKQRADPNFIY